jgi:hypothetical protein
MLGSRRPIEATGNRFLPQRGHHFALTPHPNRYKMHPMRARLWPLEDVQKAGVFAWNV